MLCRDLRVSGLYRDICICKERTLSDRARGMRWAIPVAQITYSLVVRNYPSNGRNDPLNCM